jgi:hypothetical protein
MQLIRTSLLSIASHVTAYFVSYPAWLNFLECHHQGSDLIHKRIIDLQHWFITYAKYSVLNTVVLETYFNVKIHAHILVMA